MDPHRGGTRRGPDMFIRSPSAHDASVDRHTQSSPGSLPRCQALLDWLVRFTSADGDSKQIFQEKQQFVMVLALAFIGVSASHLQLMIGMNKAGFTTFGQVVGLVVVAAIYVYMCITKRLDAVCMGGFAFAAIAALLPADVEAAVAPTERAWTGIILVMNGLLVCNAPKALCVFLMFLAVTWILLVELEYTVRYGLFDAPGLPSYESRREVFCDCTEPPCSGLRQNWCGTITAIFVIVGNFLITRSYTAKMQRQKSEVEACIQTSRAVLLHLADYDLNSAQECLDGAAAELPRTLQQVLQDLLDNLRAYRPFLPNALFSEQTSRTPLLLCHETLPIPDDEAECDGDVVPGLVSGSAAIVFTDIKGSTALWEACPEGMNEAVELHDAVIRAEISRFGGYEVKTIGDAFMVAFPTFITAIEFGVAVTRAFRVQDWPESLVAVQHEGLTVRIGAACGEMNVRQNDLTARYDYYGPVVNKAARLEAHGEVGVVSVASEQVTFTVRRALERHSIRQTGTSRVLMKGFHDPIDVLSLAHEDDAAPRRRRDRARSATVSPDTPSLGIDVGKSGPTGVPNEKFTSGLQKKCTACVVRALVAVPPTLDEEDVSATLGLVLSSAVTGAAQTHGTVINLDGSALTLGWGLERAKSRSTDRYVDSLRFCTLLRRAMAGGQPQSPLSPSTSELGGANGDDKTFCVERPSNMTSGNASRRLHFGIASGTVFFGYLGTRSVRMVAAVGPAVEAATELVRYAHEASIQSLVGSVGGGGFAWHPVLGQCLRTFAGAFVSQALPDVVVQELDETEAVQIWQDKVRQTAGDTQPQPQGAAPSGEHNNGASTNAQPGDTAARGAMSTQDMMMSLSTPSLSFKAANVASLAGSPLPASAADPSGHSAAGDVLEQMSGDYTKASGQRTSVWSSGGSRAVPNGPSTPSKADVTQPRYVPPRRLPVSPVAQTLPKPGGTSQLPANLAATPTAHSIPLLSTAMIVQSASGASTEPPLSPSSEA